MPTTLARVVVCGNLNAQPARHLNRFYNATQNGGSFEEKYLRGRAPPPDEDEERARAGVVAGVLLGEPGEALEARAQIDGLERDEDLDAGGDHRAPSARTRTTAASRVGSKPGATRTRAAPTSITRSRGESGAAAGRGTSSRNGTEGARPRRLDHQRNVLAENALPDAKASAVRPLARHAPTRSRHR